LTGTEPTAVSTIHTNVFTDLQRIADEIKTALGLIGDQDKPSGFDRKAVQAHVESYRRGLRDLENTLGRLKKHPTFVAAAAAVDPPTAPFGTILVGISKEPVTIGKGDDVSEKLRLAPFTHPPRTGEELDVFLGERNWTPTDHDQTDADRYHSVYVKPELAVILTKLGWQKAGKDSNEY
jgi:hypothetical protein